MNILCKSKRKDSQMVDLNLCFYVCVCAREKETEVYQETEVVYEILSTCACSASESVAVCLFVSMS